MVTAENEFGSNEIEYKIIRNRYIVPRSLLSAGKKKKKERTEKSESEGERN